jgi:mono/diheme cytochrome c family protein
MKYKIMPIFLQVIAIIFMMIAASCSGSPSQTPIGGTQSPAVASSSTPAQATISSPSVSIPQTSSVTDPAQIYAANCAGCHGNDRTGGGAGPNIKAAALNSLTATDLANFIARHQTGRSLTANDVSLLANWLKSTP